MKRAVARTLVRKSAFLAGLLGTVDRNDKCGFGTVQAAVSVFLMFATVALMRLVLVTLTNGIY